MEIDGPPLVEPASPLNHLLRMGLALDPDAVAIESGYRRLTWAELEEESARLAALSPSSSVGRTSVVSIIGMASCRERAVSAHGTVRPYIQRRSCRTRTRSMVPRREMLSARRLRSQHCHDGRHRWHERTAREFSIAPPLRRYNRP